MRELAIRAAKEAGKILIDNFGRIHKITKKSGRELVTNVDLEAQTTIISLIKEKYPHHSILSEESPAEENHSKYRWIIDPLDGTHNYIHKVGIFGVSIALEWEEEIILGVIFLPVTAELYVAEKGKGAYLNNERIAVSRRDLPQVSMVYDSSLQYNKEVMLTNLGKLADNVFNVRMFGSSARSLSFIANGQIDLQIEYHDKPWDFSAGALIVEEAGGKVTDLQGNPWTPQVDQYIASNSKIHQDILRILQEE